MRRGAGAGEDMLATGALYCGRGAGEEFLVGEKEGRRVVVGGNEEWGLLMKL